MAVCGKPGTRNKFLLFALLSVVLFGCVYCQAQVAGAEGANLDDMTIGSVEVQGNVTVTRSQVLSKVRARAGQLFDENAADEDVARIYEIEGVQHVDFNTVVVDNQVKLTFVVAEMNLVRSIVFQGNKAFGEKKFLKELDFKRGDYLDVSNVYSGKAAIRDMYVKKGYSAVKVEVSDEKLGVGKVVFEIDEGVRTTIKEIRFEGNNAFTAKELLRAMKTKPKKFLFWPVRYNAEEIDADKDSLFEVYRKRGYLDSKVSVSVESNADRRWAYVTFKIDEGPVYIVDEIVVTGNQHFSDEELRSELKLKVGDFYSDDRADYDVRHIRGRFREVGFVNAGAQVDGILVAPGKVKVEFTVSQGECFRIGRIDITG